MTMRVKDTIKVTALAMSIVDEIRSDLKRRGRARDFYNKDKKEMERQEWISKVTHQIMIAEVR